MLYDPWVKVLYDVVYPMGQGILSRHIPHGSREKSSWMVCLVIFFVSDDLVRVKIPKQIFNRQSGHSGHRRHGGRERKGLGESWTIPSFYTPNKRPYPTVGLVSNVVAWWKPKLLWPSTLNRCSCVATMGPAKKLLPPCELWGDFLVTCCWQSRQILGRCCYIQGKWAVSIVQHGPRHPGFSQKNLPQHLKCASHIKSVGVEQAWRETQEHLNCLHAKDLEWLWQPAYQYGLLLHPNQPNILVPAMPLSNADEQQMWDDFDFDQSGKLLHCANLGDQVNPIDQEEIEFYRTLDRASADSDLSGKGFDEFNIVQDMDETLTNVMGDPG